ncbi:hypothetical protein [Leptothoe spongobia]|uniref:Uncharacterized protein n=1 Tax=Leptothoe spongobia TAU-MAC 1115 TaxID=1967444 RepID=A0A947GKW0_9CYAN|nr:hypothetical protein [Leptothoe spongobia]MBT9318055.1 hypothetical protein [Leptothoe spongobia TAU-MAC 1115]
MTSQRETKARIQYSSRDALDVAVIGYCRGQSRHDLHYRTRQALNGFYAPFAMVAVDASADEVRRQALRSIRQLTTQILEIQEQFLPELLGLEAGLGGLSLGNGGRGVKERGDAISVEKSGGAISVEKSGVAISASQSPTTMEKAANSGPVDPQLRAFLGEDAAIMAGLNPFINDLT